MALELVEAQVETLRAIQLEGEAHDGIPMRLVQEQHGGMFIRRLLLADDRAVAHLPIALHAAPRAGQRIAGKLLIHDELAGLVQERLEVSGLLGEAKCGGNDEAGKRGEELGTHDRNELFWQCASGQTTEPAWRLPDPAATTRTRFTIS